MDDNQDCIHASAETQEYELSSRIKLQVRDIKALNVWLSRQSVVDITPVEITVSNASGIGPSVEVKIETMEGEGLWKDLTDYGSW